ncbi:hypothetical protein HYH03_018837 [Edaphochlamys debaryana]|uniref:CCHC-type domain-containing protein n=1 Tax=Edaphochlamys debaryana TaxID=47281 RepID=A0A836BMX4_9CHLO|nr:hypothetical protein HYH03_018837 [Edaphochlamys debaryana]|eukprot:KAG2482217.1 hypothetical protein HYH03_018837 [Edaphochlamys debaryana]
MYRYTAAFHGDFKATLALLKAPQPAQQLGAGPAAVSAAVPAAVPVAVPVAVPAAVWPPYQQPQLQWEQEPERLAGHVTPRRPLTDAQFSALRAAAKPGFCYHCGELGHTVRGCKGWRRSTRCRGSSCAASTFELQRLLQPPTGLPPPPRAVAASPVSRGARFALKGGGRGAAHPPGSGSRTGGD